MEVWKYRQIVKFPKISIKIKNFKPFYETQTASCPNELFSLPAPPSGLAAPLTPPDKSLLRLCNKYFLTEKYINIQIVFKVLRECSSWVSRNVQCSFIISMLRMSNWFFVFKNKNCRVYQEFAFEFTDWLIWLVHQFWLVHLII